MLTKTKQRRPRPGELGPPSADKRWKVVEAVMRRHGNARRGLIETLHVVQESFGYIDEDAMRYVADHLRVPLSEVFGVATFYHFFRLKPKGEHTCVVCLGTACYIKGAPDIVEAVGREFGIQPGGTTSDGKVSLLTARCVGACSLAPAVVLDGEVLPNATPGAVVEALRRCISDAAR